MPIKHLVRELYWNHLGNLGDEHRKVRRISSLPSWSWCGWEGGIVLPKIELRTYITEIQISDEGAIRQYDENGRLLESASLAVPAPLPLPLSEKPSKQQITLSFEAHTSRLCLDTSSINQDGLVLIAPKRRNICGVIHCAHLSPESLMENTDEFLECILIASCHRSGAFNPCNYPRDKLELSNWFSHSEAKPPTKHGNVTELHSRAINQSPIQPEKPAFRRRLTAPSSTELRAWVWKRKLKGIFWTHNPIARALEFIAFIILLVTALPVAFTLFVTLLPIMTILLVLSTLLLLLLWSFQAIRRFFRYKQKWYLWDSMVTTRLGKWVDDTVIVPLPKMMQNIFYKVFSEHPDREAQQLKKRENVVNIILVKRRVVDGIEVCERLAIGEMSAHCWWESQPMRGRIVLQ
jgi:hypothetical protein